MGEKLHPEGRKLVGVGEFEFDVAFAVADKGRHPGYRGGEIFADQDVGLSRLDRRRGGNCIHRGGFFHHCHPGVGIAAHRRLRQVSYLIECYLLAVVEARLVGVIDSRQGSGSRQELLPAVGGEALGGFIEDDGGALRVGPRLDAEAVLLPRQGGVLEAGEFQREVPAVGGAPAGDALGVALFVLEVDDVESHRVGPGCFVIEAQFGCSGGPPIGVGGDGAAVAGCLSVIAGLTGNLLQPFGQQDIAAAVHLINQPDRLVSGDHLERGSISAQILEIILRGLLLFAFPAHAAPGAELLGFAAGIAQLQAYAVPYVTRLRIHGDIQFEAPVRGDFDLAHILVFAVQGVTPAGIRAGEAVPGIGRRLAADANFLQRQPLFRLPVEHHVEGWQHEVIYQHRGRRDGIVGLIFDVEPIPAVFLRAGKHERPAEAAERTGSFVQTAQYVALGVLEHGSVLFAFGSLCVTVFSVIDYRFEAQSFAGIVGAPVCEDLAVAQGGVVVDAGLVIRPQGDGAGCPRDAVFASADQPHIMQIVFFALARKGDEFLRNGSETVQGDALEAPGYLLVSDEFDVYFGEGLAAQVVGRPHRRAVGVVTQRRRDGVFAPDYVVLQLAGAALDVILTVVQCRKGNLNCIR